MDLIIFIAMFLILWYAVSDNVMAGAIVIESPVCIPIGSRFSIEQIIITLSLSSLRSSSSYSFQPRTALSINTSWIGEACKPFDNNFSKSSLLWTKDAPEPPNVNEGLITRGKPSSWAIALPSKNDVAIFAGATGISISCINFLNCSLSSVISIALISTPIIFTLYFSQMPFSFASMHKFSAVWPPIVGKTASISLSSRISTIDLVSSGFR